MAETEQNPIQIKQAKKEKTSEEKHRFYQNLQTKNHSLFFYFLYIKPSLMMIQMTKQEYRL